MNNKYVGFAVTAILISTGIGLYTKNMTGLITNALLSGAFILIFSITFFFLYHRIEAGKKSCVTRRDRYKLCILNIGVFLICALYIASFEYVLIKCSGQAPFGVCFHVIVLLLLFLLSIANLIYDLKKTNAD